MFFPEYTKYPYSFKALKTAQEELEISENEILRSETIIPEKITARDGAEEQAQTSELSAEEIRSKLNMDDMKYHIPSLLVTLEQAAIEREISEKKFFIEYDLIKTTTNADGATYDPSARPGKDGQLDPSAIPEQSDPNTANPADTTGTITPKTPSATPTDTPAETGTEASGDEEESIMGDPKVAIAYDKPPMIPGVSVTTIPIRLLGVTYAQARDYIAFLDNLDFVEPTYLDIYSDGQGTSLVALIHVFHKEGGF